MARANHHAACAREDFITRAGTPTTVALPGTSRITTAPAPITAFSPTLRHWITFAPSPTNAPAPTYTRPAISAPGQTCAPSSIANS